MNFDTKICWFTRFIVKRRESKLRTFCRQFHQCAKIGGRGGGGKPILAMPRFWERLLPQPLHCLMVLARVMVIACVMVLAPVMVLARVKVLACIMVLTRMVLACLEIFCEV